MKIIKGAALSKRMRIMFGVTRLTYTAYESGRRKSDNNTLIKITRYLGVSTDYLLGLIDIKDHLKLIASKPRHF